jgi:hypothetical protein
VIQLTQVIVVHAKHEAEVEAEFLIICINLDFFHDMH